MHSGCSRLHLRQQPKFFRMAGWGVIGANTEVLDLDEEHREGRWVVRMFAEAMTLQALDGCREPSNVWKHLVKTKSLKVWQTISVKFSWTTIAYSSGVQVEHFER